MLDKNILCTYKLLFPFKYYTASQKEVTLSRVDILRIKGVRRDIGFYPNLKQRAKIKGFKDTIDKYINTKSDINNSGEFILDETKKIIGLMDYLSHNINPDSLKAEVGIEIELDTIIENMIWKEVMGDRTCVYDPDNDQYLNITELRCMDCLDIEGINGEVKKKIRKRVGVIGDFEISFIKQGLININSQGTINVNYFFATLIQMLDFLFPQYEYIDDFAILMHFATSKNFKQDTLYLLRYMKGVYTINDYNNMHLDEILEFYNLISSLIEEEVKNRKSDA